MLVKENSLLRMSWRKGQLINVIRGVDKLITGAGIKVRQHNSHKMFALKKSLKCLVPFNIMDADKCRTENNDVTIDNTPVEITPSVHYG